MIGWWSEVVVVPCLARGASDSRTAIMLAEAGADFVAIRAELYARNPGLASNLAALTPASGQ